MDSNFSLLIIIALLTTSWYYYMKYKEYEKEVIILSNNVTKMNIENTNYRVRIKDLQKYKNDVSKTFKILDNELVHINNHVEKNNQQLQSQQSQLPIPQLQNQSNRINLLTPDMLNNLIENMNQELSFYIPSEAMNGLTPQNTPGDISPIMQFSLQQDQHQQQVSNEEPSQQPQEQQVSIEEQPQQQEQPEAEEQIQQQEQPHEPSFVEETRNTLSNLLQSNNGTSIFRTMSFPNLPSAYQRLMIPISESVISRMSNPTIGNDFNVPVPSLQTTDN